MALDFSRFTHLTFDCYGTLIDWESGILAALRPVVAAHDVTLPYDHQLLALYASLESEIETGPYRPYREVLAEVVRGMGKRMGFVPTERETTVLADSLKDWQPFPDTVDALRRLERRFKLVILSNVDDDLFAATATRLQVRFSDVITAQQARSYKPSLNNFRLALERIGAPSEKVLHVAQSRFHDVAPAKSLGLATVWVNRRHGRPGKGATPDLNILPDLEVPDMSTLAKLVEPTAT